MPEELTVETWRRRRRLGKRGRLSAPEEARALHPKGCRLTLVGVQMRQSQAKSRRMPRRSCIVGLAGRLRLNGLGKVLRPCLDCRAMGATDHRERTKPAG